MSYVLEAACISMKSVCGSMNEDNLFFGGKTLPLGHKDMRDPLRMTCTIDAPVCFAVFDGLGGEKYGEYASCAAAEELKAVLVSAADEIPHGDQFLDDAFQTMNAAVLRVGSRFKTDRIGSTAAVLLFIGGDVFIGNLGDSRVYCWRDSELCQMSVDHLQTYYRGMGMKKAPLLQHLGIPEKEFLIEPLVRKEQLVAGDVFLLCTDGLSDVLEDEEIARILDGDPLPGSCVEALLDTVRRKGLPDDVSIIVCRVADTCRAE